MTESSRPVYDAARDASSTPRSAPADRCPHDAWSECITRELRHQNLLRAFIAPATSTWQPGCDCHRGLAGQHAQRSAIRRAIWIMAAHNCIKRLYKESVQVRPVLAGAACIRDDTCALMVSGPHPPRPGCRRWTPRGQVPPLAESRAECQGRGPSQICFKMPGAG